MPKIAYPTELEIEIDHSLKFGKDFPLIRSSQHSSDFYSNPAPNNDIYTSHNLPHHNFPLNPQTYPPTTPYIYPNNPPQIFQIYCQHTHTTTYIHSQTLEIIEITYHPQEMENTHSIPEIGPITTIWWPL